MNIELRHFRYVIAVARTGSFSRAAEELHTSQPAVSKRIQEIEIDLGTRLFDRYRGGARPTALCLELTTAAKRIIDEVQTLQERSKANGKGRAGGLSIGFFKTLSSPKLRHGLKTFRQLYPDVTPELVEQPFADILGGIRSSLLDVAIVPGGGANSHEELEVLPLWSERIRVVLSREHPLVERQALSWRDIAGETFLISRYDPGPDVEAVLMRNLAGAGYRPDVRHMRMRRESLLALVAAGDGISLQPETAILIDDPDIAIRDIHDPAGPPHLDYVACWRRTNTSPVLANFPALLKAQSAIPAFHSGVNPIDSTARGEDSSISPNEEPI
ncbi:LysR family transcriptional regulator [Brucella pseudogrignonensis]|uniref:LysR family transcriptional regulator n=1 Tax=Brucella pseudogrignonensis TaxID=419475 RepID=UPI001E3D400A|nr:LysR family transcriptional regulator [Brucella pseudogrignonensis]MCD4512179.1 LysR family transcriptional regulator [Brucella pseudogrignonensis]